MGAQLAIDACPIAKSDARKAAMKNTHTARLFVLAATALAAFGAAEAEPQSAVEMAQIEVDSGTNPDAVAMAQASIDTQNIEIKTMREILQSL